MSDSRTADPPHACRLCQGATAPLMERRGFTILRCGSCGFMFAAIPEGHDPSALYFADRYFRQGAEQLSITEPALYPPRLLRIAGFQPPERMLEVGCAAGGFLKAAQARGWQVFGMEPSARLREQAMAALARPVFASLDQPLSAGQRFQCVAMFEVLEHAADPLALMRQAVALLAPGGVLALSTPNCASRDAYRPPAASVDVWFIPPEHISYFGPGTLRRCAQTAGLEVLALEGLQGYWRAMAGDTALPSWMAVLLRPLRRGKRLRPAGAPGRWLKARFNPSRRPDLYRRRSVPDPAELDVLELYCRKPL